MDDLEQVVKQRINVMDLDILCDAIDKLKQYNINFYNNQGKFNFNKFRKDCHKTVKLLFKKDESINGIRYQMCDCLNAIQTIVGIRNSVEFMSEDNLLK